MRLTKLIALSLSLVMAPVILSAEPCLTAASSDYRVNIAVPTTRSDDTALAASEIAGYELFIRGEDDEQTTAYAVGAESQCYINVPRLPYTINAQGVAIDTLDQRSTDSKIYTLTFSSVPDTIDLPLPIITAPPNGVTLTVDVPEGVTVKVEVLEGNK